MKVLGLDQYTDSGELGTSSAGYTRIWRVTHPDKQSNDMMLDALATWRMIETATNTKLLEDFPIINFGHPDSKFLQGVFSQFPGEKLLDAKAIKDAYPALFNIPENYVGMVTTSSKP